MMTYFALDNNHAKIRHAWSLTHKVPAPQIFSYQLFKKVFSLNWYTVKCYYTCRDAWGVGWDTAFRGGSRGRGTSYLCSSKKVEHNNVNFVAT